MSDNNNNHYNYYTAAIIFIVALPILYFLGLFQTPLFRYIPIITIISTIVLYFISIIIILIYNEKKSLSNIRVKETIGIVLFFISIVIVLNIMFFLSKYLLFYSTFTSVLLSIIFIILILAILVSLQSFLITFHENDLEHDIIYELLKDIIFTIPCLVSDFFTWIQGEIDGFPSPTIILTMLISLFIIVFYLFPFILGKMKFTKGVPLITTPKSLDNVVLHLSQDQLKDKIISFKPVATRKLLEKNDEFKNYLDDNKIKEGFNENIHLLDKKLMFSKSDFKSLGEKEKEMVKNATTLDDFNSLSEFNQYIKSIMKSGQDSIFPYLSNTIKEYTDNNSKYIHQKSSKFVNWVNRTNNISDLTYHGAISFWVYFDPSIHNLQHSGNVGLIFTYSDNPKIVYDYNENVIVSTIRKCNYKTISPEEKQMECEDNVIYKSDNILFQRWNLFVVNFNYGTLDIFINNNLVSSTENVSPYTERAFLQFGSSSHKLYNCGICSASYHDKPLTLSNISQMYRNNEAPCFGDKL